MEQKFTYENFPIRVITDEEDQAWFAGVDVCAILEYVDTRQVIEKLDEDERRLDGIQDRSGQQRKTWMVNEPGLYSLILSSSKPEAKAFKRWITHEVLPSIRKAGKYTTEQEKNRETQLRAIAKQVQDLILRKDQLQKDINGVRKDIDQKTGEMMALVQTDPNVIYIPFPNNN